MPHEKTSPRVDVPRSRATPARAKSPARGVTKRNAGICVSPQENLGAVRETFRSESELARLSADWPVSRLIEIWNRLPGVKPVRRFEDRRTAVRRIWREVQKMKMVSSKQELAVKESSPGAQVRNRTRVQNHRAARRTKTDQIIALLKRPTGATLATLMAATGWQAHSVRGFISGQLRKRMGLDVKSMERGGRRFYAIPR